MAAGAPLHPGDRRRPLSPDPGASTTFEVHRRLLAADRCGLENLANLRHIAPRGTEAIIGVAPWE